MEMKNTLIAWQVTFVSSLYISSKSTIKENMEVMIREYPKFLNIQFILLTKRFALYSYVVTVKRAHFRMVCNKALSDSADAVWWTHIRWTKGKSREQNSLIFLIQMLLRQKDLVSVNCWTSYTPQTQEYTSGIWPKRIYNPVTAMGFLAMFTFQLDNTKR